MAVSTKYMIRLPKPLKDMLAKRADTMGISLNALLVQILWEYMEKRMSA